MSVEEFLESTLGSQGPSWLTFPRANWPAEKPPSVPENILEIRQVSAVVHSASTVNPIFLRWSSYTRLLHVIGYCLRFIENIRVNARTQPPPGSHPALRALTVKQLAQAKTTLIKLAQNDAFHSELNDLKEEKTIDERSKIRRMSPFLDREGVLRVGGRLKLAQLPYQAKHPAILPSFHPFSLLIAHHYHHQMLHAGGRLLLNAIREEFWPLQGRKLAHNVVRKCMRCTRLDPIPAQQQIGQLPAHRVIPSSPFNVTGVDYADPFYLRPVHKRAAPAKAYLCLFVCFETKAVHLELVSDLSTEGFLLALQRFIAHRGRPAHIHSDNGKNCEGAKNKLNERFDLLRKSEETEKIVSTCAAEGITWHLNPPKAPHFGGLWEAAVKVAKKHLYRQLGSTRVSFEHLTTILAQIESLMNSRPLLPMSEDPNNLAALTPRHFLTGSSLLALPDPDHRDIPENRLDHFQKLQLHVQNFGVTGAQSTSKKCRMIPR
ncbi:uncharacterized protein LOC128732344 [Sabethes cyaneus]|uniref:uncharacterized protein LOC128732344 n=1 Tax=Sabethes cyaneus TaxID=53552 RepID=UPI00237ED2C0|nr:uncharacterized protein LOC128732344 [Sabethes cyaneus]